MSEGACRSCGCTEERACVDVWGDACSWSERDRSICSFCDEGVPCDSGGDEEAVLAFAGEWRARFEGRGG